MGQVNPPKQTAKSVRPSRDGSQIRSEAKLRKLCRDVFLDKPEESFMILLASAGSFAHVLLRLKVVYVCLDPGYNQCL